MLRYKLYKNNNKKMSSYNKWYPRIIVEETVDVEGLARHMAKHNSGYNPGIIKGVLTDAIACVKELVLEGKNVKLNDLAIFSLGMKVKSGAPSEDDFDPQTHIKGFHLRARATGELRSQQVKGEVTLKRVTTLKTSTVSPQAEQYADSGEKPLA